MKDAEGLRSTITDATSKTPHPLLARFAVNRTDAPGLPGRYCAVRDVWVVGHPPTSMPIVEIVSATEFIPITKIQGERADPGVSALLELATKTRQPLERDDLGRSDMSLLLELATKTDAVPERDDK